MFDPSIESFEHCSYKHIFRDSYNVGLQSSAQLIRQINMLEILDIETPYIILDKQGTTKLLDCTIA